MSQLNRKNLADIPEYKHYSLLRLISFLMIGLIGITIIGGAFFVYNNIYIAIGQTQVFMNIDQSLAIEVIDFAKYDRVDKTWQDKYSDEELVISRDPFNMVLTTEKKADE